jgi:hypothetical protein
MMKNILCLLVVGLFTVGCFAGLTSAENVETVMPTLKGYMAHAPIHIDGNAQFIPNATNGVVNGTGTESDPYFIAYWQIDINNSGMVGIRITSTNKHFIISNCLIRSNSNVNTCGIKFYNVSYGTITNCMIEGFDTGVQFGDHHENPGTNGCILTHSDIRNNTEGIDIWNSYQNSITYNNISGNNIGVYRHTCKLSPLLYFYGECHSIHHNNFINNIKIPSSTEKDICCDDNISEGNYWSDYQTRYPAASNNGHVWNISYTTYRNVTEDRYPLVNPVPDAGAKITNPHLSPFLPSAPQNLLATVNGAQVTLKWNTPSSTGNPSVLNYKIFWGMSSRDYSKCITFGNITTYTFTNLIRGVRYYFSVCAVNSVGDGPNSDEVSVIIEQQNKESIPYFTILIMISTIVIIVIVSVAIYIRRKRNPAPTAPTQPPDSPKPESSSGDAEETVSPGPPVENP